MDSWLAEAGKLAAAGEDFVIVAVLGAIGSAPAEAGRRMLVTGSTFAGTIGGGQLERHAQQTARTMLDGREASRIEDYALGAKLGQCCGGRVVLHFELQQAHQPHIAVFGAGHVAAELAAILARLPYRSLFVDARAQWLERLPTAANLAVRCEEQPADAIPDLPAGAICLVMTHSHSLDLELARLLLEWDKFAYLGVIGSASKAARFRSQLERRGLDSSRLHCPIGKSCGKHPAEVAVSIAGEIVAHAGKASARRTPPAQQRQAVRLLAELAAQERSVR